MMSQFSAIEKPIYMCILLFSVYCFQFAILYNTKFLIQLLHRIKTETANNHIDPQIIPQLSNILDANACDVMLKIPLKKALEKTCNYYNNNKCNIEWVVSFCKEGEGPFLVVCLGPLFLLIRPCLSVQDLVYHFDLREKLNGSLGHICGMRA